MESLIRFTYRLQLSVLFLLLFSLIQTGFAQSNQAITIGALFVELDENGDNAFTEYLENQLPGYDFQIRNFDSVDELILASEQSQVDFAFLIPPAYVELTLSKDARVLATVIQNTSGIYLPWLTGVAFTLESRNDINTLEDIAGSRVATISVHSIGGWYAVIRELLAYDRNIEDHLETQDFFFTNTDVIDAVCNGSADIGFITSRRYWPLVDNCDLPLKVLPLREESQDISYPLPRSTRVYPEIAFTMTTIQDEDFIRELSQALLNIAPGSDIVAPLGVGGFTSPLSYSEVQSLMEELSYGPFSEFGTLTIRQFVSDYIFSITIALALLVVLISGALVNASRLSRKYRNSERYRKQVFEGSRIALIVIDPATSTFLDMNPAALKLFGYQDKADLVGKSVTTVFAPGQNISGSIPSAMHHYEQKVMVEGMTTFEWRYLRPDGTTWDGLVHLMVFDSGEKNLFQGTIEDITDKLRQESERKALEQQLEFSQRMESIGRLAGGIAHDFNNLLTVINGYSEMLLMEQDPKHARVLEQIRKAGLRAAELTQQLLTFSRKKLTRHVPIDVNLVILDAAEMMKSVLGEEIRLDLQLCDDPEHVLSNTGQLQQVLLNLVVNSKDAMPEGGLLVIGTRVLQIEKMLAASLNLEPGRYVEIKVTDTGLGMDEKISRHIFEPFFTTKENYGTGLGLASVYGIVQQSGGHIRVDSTPGQGTTFHIVLPVTNAEIVDLEPVVEEIGPTLGSPTILVVEDQEEVRDFIISVLEKQGYTILAAESGTDALSLLKENNSTVDLLLTDIVMQGMSGPELAEIFSKEHQGIPVLFISGYPEDEITRHGVQQGTMEFLAKPLTPKELLARISRLLKNQSNQA